MPKCISFFDGFVKIHMPHQNLGCLGVAINDRYLGDLILTAFGDRRLALYWKYNGKRHWFSFSTLRYTAKAF